MSKLSEQEKAIIVSHPFAQILSAPLNHKDFSELVYCPLQLLENNTLLGHLANNNPFLKVVDDKSKIKVIFTGPHGYISPRWHSEQLVPTWNYATTSLTCQLNKIQPSDEKITAMAKISQHFDPQWDFNEFNKLKNQKIVQQMLSAITVFELEVLEVKSKFKLSQNRSVECRMAFQKNLRLTGYSELADIQLQ